MYYVCIFVCMSFLYLHECVCIVCICLYFLHEKLLVASIQTHSARYIQYIPNTDAIHQKYIANTDTFWQIQTKNFKNPCFFTPFFLVCILYVLYLSCCMLFLDTCHIQQGYYVYVCVCIVCMCMYSSVCSLLKMCKYNFLGRKLCLSALAPKSSKLFFAGWPLYVCVCIVCMCLYCMYRLYEPVLYELMLYLLVLQRQAQ